jgi:endonuclease/exonuclease/phosphatase family metal-dependent hydrolase
MPMLKLFKILIVFLLLLFLQPAFAEKSVCSFTLGTWNIQVGSDDPANGNGWLKRRSALLETIKSAKVDILCTQEGLLNQLAAIDLAHPELQRVGGGRDDGKEKGEFCAIYFRSSKFELIRTKTFWLSDTPFTPETTWDAPYKRICTQVLLKDKVSGQQFFVFNTHFPLNEQACVKAASLIAYRIVCRKEDAPVILAGDFNCEPDSQPWKIFKSIDLTPSDPLQRKTYHLDGDPKACVDAIFCSPDFAAQNYQLLDQKVEGVYPSDHFGSTVQISLTSGP